MAQNFLYMFEFVVDDLLVTRPNFCAPEEYPTCCEVSFRNSVFVSMCDREFGQCVDPSAPKCGKCCLFSLESPINEADKLLIHIFKKKTDKCKFLIGCTDLPIKNLFDKVMESFNIENPNWEDGMRKHLQSLPTTKGPAKAPEIVDNDCNEDSDDRPEQLCPTSELTKRLLPLFNLKGCQTGNVVLIIRLVANGPAIVSSFPFGKTCNAGCGKKPPNGDNGKCAAHTCGAAGRIGGGGNDRTYTADIPRCVGGNETAVAEGNGNNACSDTKEYRNYKSPENGCLPMCDPCVKRVKKNACQRYFACNADKGCPCEDVEDECDRAPKCKNQKCKREGCGSAPPPPCCPPPPPPRTEQTCSSCEECMNECDAGPTSCSADTCDDTVRNPCDPCGQCLQPCFVTPRPPEPGPDAYDEFEACLNGSGLVIRVLKDTHCVENIFDGTESATVAENDTECGKENLQSPNFDINQLLERSTFARNHIKRRTGGSIINHPKLPKIRANIKYSGNESCCADSYQVPFSNIKKFCNDQANKIESYRSRRRRQFGGGACEEECGPAFQPPLHPHDNKSCCVQVDREDIRNALKGINGDNRKKGIEVCYKTCDDTDTDVFLVKLGSKQKCQHKKNNIEIELKTPKEPIILPSRRVTTETQIDEAELDAALSGVCAKKGKKGKKTK